MKITQTPNELTIQETPGCLWIFGLFFVIIGGILIYGTLGGFSNWNEVPAWQLVLAFFIAVSVVSGGVWVNFRRTDHKSCYQPNRRFCFNH